MHNARVHNARARVPPFATPLPPLFRPSSPSTRTQSLLKRAMASIPLVADADGPPLQLLFEDEHIVVVNKPPRMQTAPVHRSAPTIASRLGYSCLTWGQRCRGALGGCMHVRPGPDSRLAGCCSYGGCCSDVWLLGLRRTWRVVRYRTCT